VSDDTESPFAAAIQDHLDLKRRNAVLEIEMPLSSYMRTFENQRGQSVEGDAGSREDDTLVTVSWPSPAA
jgi:hypothetical protein